MEDKLVYRIIISEDDLDAITEKVANAAAKGMSQGTGGPYTPSAKQQAMDMAEEIRSGVRGARGQTVAGPTSNQTFNTSVSSFASAVASFRTGVAAFIRNASRGGTGSGSGSGGRGGGGAGGAGTTSGSSSNQSSMAAQLRSLIGGNLHAGPNSVLGQAIRSFGFGGMMGHGMGRFFAHTIGNLPATGNIPGFLHLAMQGRGGARGMLGQAALRGTGGMIAGNLGAAIATHPLGQLALAAMAAVKGFGIFSNEMDKLVEHLGQYDSQTSQAQGRREANQIKNDVRMAHELSDQMTMWENFRTEMDSLTTNIELGMIRVGKVLWDVNPFTHAISAITEGAQKLGLSMTDAAAILFPAFGWIAKIGEIGEMGNADAARNFMGFDPNMNPHMVNAGRDAPGHAMGGMIYRNGGGMSIFQPRGTDTVPAMLTPGEFIVNERATRRFLPELQHINHFADGGVVPNIKAAARRLKESDSPWSASSRTGPGVSWGSPPDAQSSAWDYMNQRNISHDYMTPRHIREMYPMDRGRHRKDGSLISDAAKEAAMQAEFSAFGWLRTKVMEATGRNPSILDDTYKSPQSRSGIGGYQGGRSIADYAMAAMKTIGHALSPDLGGGGPPTAMNAVAMPAQQNPDPNGVGNPVMPAAAPLGGPNPVNAPPPDATNAPSGARSASTTPPASSPATHAGISVNQNFDINNCFEIKTDEMVHGVVERLRHELALAANQAQSEASMAIALLGGMSGMPLDYGM